MREYTEEEIQHTKYLDDMLTYYGKNGLVELTEQQIRDYREEEGNVCDGYVHGRAGKAER